MKSLGFQLQFRRGSNTVARHGSVFNAVGPEVAFRTSTNVYTTEFTVRRSGSEESMIAQEMLHGVWSPKNVLVQCFCGNKRYYTNALLKQDHAMAVNLCVDFFVARKQFINILRGLGVKGWVRCRGSGFSFVLTDGCT